MPNLLLMSSDLFLRRISTAASNAEFVITNAVTSDKALIVLRDNQYDSVIVNFDGAVIDTDELDLIRQIRKLTSAVIVVIFDDLHAVKIRCYAAGADLVMLAPYDPETLIDCIYNMLRKRNEPVPVDTYTARGLELNTTTRTISVKYDIVPLTGEEYTLIEYLVLNKDTVVTIDTLCSHLYPDQCDSIPNYDCRDFVRIHEYRAMKKLRDAGATNRIMSVGGRGYILSGPSTIKN